MTCFNLPRHWGKLKQGPGQIETTNLDTLYWTQLNHVVKENSSKPIINQPHLKKWRPISLINIDIKIASSAIQDV